MAVEATLAVSAFALAVWFVVARVSEHRWLPPSALFFVGFFFHAFITPYVYDQLGAINAGNLPFIIQYSFFAFVAAIIGYWVGLRLKWGIRAYGQRAPVDFRYASGALIRVVAVILALYSMIYIIALGSLDEAKGVGTNVTDSSGPVFGKVAIALPSLLVAWYMFLQARPSKAARPEWILYVVTLLAVVTTNLALFARRDVLATALLIGLYHHFRVSRISVARAMLLASLLFAVQLIASLRSLDAGLAQLNVGAVTSHISEVMHKGFVHMLISLATSLPGQDVFAEVIDIARTTGYRGGLTYVQSVIGLFTPAFLGFQPLWETPAAWFHAEYAPHVEHHGFDFSALAESYLNFGEFGYFVFFFFGLVIAWASKAIQRSASFYVVLFGLITVVGLTFGLRTDSYALLKSIVYMWLAVVALAKAGLWLRSRGRRRQAIRATPPN